MNLLGSFACAVLKNNIALYNEIMFHPTLEETKFNDLVDIGIRLRS